ncbi:hypothetical protein KR009_012075 [Drosophila setifemur]|nr:hypothetical protein KR009_012075 [Drosophila setifemur]
MHVLRCLGLFIWGGLSRFEAMEWSKYLVLLLELLFLLGASSQQEKPCNAEIWISPEILQLGKPYDVFCRCNSSETLDLQYLAIKKRPSYFETLTLETVSVDNVTIKAREERFQDRSTLSYECAWRGHDLGYFSLGEPLDFQCRIDRFNQASCTFLHAGYRDYKMTVDSQPQVVCRQMRNDESLVVCEPIPLPRRSELYKFELSMEYGKKAQVMELTLYDRQMRVPLWLGQRMEKVGDKFCIIIEDRGPNGSETEQWRIRFQPNWFGGEQFKMDPYLIELLARFEHPEGECFEAALMANLYYEVFLMRCYLHMDSQWSSELGITQFQTPATLPPCPEVLPHGFFHDLVNRQLYVFWEPVHKLHQNGADFEYIVTTDTGMKALSVDSHCAVFPSWNGSLPATVLVRSKNSVGFSTNCSWLDIPVLAKARRYRAQSLKRNIAENYISWLPPKVKEVGGNTYTLYWCPAPENTSQVCDGEEQIDSREVNRRQMRYRFFTPMGLSNFAVTTNKGGMTWIGPSFPKAKRKRKISGPGIINYSLGFGFLLLSGSIFAVLFRKLRKMSRIEVMLPEGLPNSAQPTSWSTSPKAPITIPGSISPQAVLDLAKFNIPSAGEQEPNNDDPPPYVAPICTHYLQLKGFKPAQIGYTVAEAINDSEGG